MARIETGHIVAPVRESVFGQKLAPQLQQAGCRKKQFWRVAASFFLCSAGILPALLTLSLSGR
jgi:hypothetical protein